MASKFSTGNLASRRHKDLPAGYRPVRVEWKDLDKCNVCHMDEVCAIIFYLLINGSYTIASFLLIDASIYLISIDVL